MSDSEELTEASTTSEISSPRVSLRTKSISKNTIGLFAPQGNVLHKDLDKNCFYKFDDPLVRIEYPGHIKNVNRALETLGGIEEVQRALDGRKLELTFHPKNHYMKGCTADVDQNVGILVKVKQSKDCEELQYEILGASDTSFRFNRMCDFQYLPLQVKEKPETNESEVEYIHNKIIVENIPTMDWFTKKETKNNPLFLQSGGFARFDQPQARFQTNSAESFNSMVRNNAPQLIDFGQKYVKQKVITAAVRVSLMKNVETPLEPLPTALQNVKTKFLQEHLKSVKRIFEERPIWTRPAIMHKAQISSDSAKYVLPCVAYYCYGGPWRTCWIKFGFNPVADYSSRIYQVLDFRIRHTEGMQERVKLKRTRDSPAENPENKIREDSYLMRPGQIPPARQMFYQYCDIHIPEIQEMLLKLPKLSANAQFDSRNGWLPISFQDQCREIVNRYIFKAVQQELKKEQKPAAKPSDVATYCSQMLHNIRKGFSESVGEYSRAQDGVVEEIDLSDEEVDPNTVVDSLPERLPEALEEEDEDSDLDIDMEVVEEINEIVARVKDQKL